jgi:hypothetical protein
MHSDYPVIKIPPLIVQAQLKSLKPKQALAINTPIGSGLGLGGQVPKYAKCLRSAGYGLLFISALIFTVAVVSNISMLSFSFISLLFGIAAINGASLVSHQQLQKTTSVAKTEAVSVSSEAAIDWSVLLAGKVMPYGGEATAQMGVSEKQFGAFLTQYFGEILHPGYEFQISADYKYSSDFTLILGNGISLIVEVDEPYEGKSKKPHHCTDEDKDERRDEFFLKGNWVVIRFSEFQVCAYPIECCYEIARTIDSIDRGVNFSRAFKGVSELPRGRRWNTQQAMAMAARDYRLEYLEKYGVYRHNRKNQ